VDESIIGQSLPKAVVVPQLIDLFEQRHTEDFVWRADITPCRTAALQGQLSPLPGVGYGAVLRDITRLKELIASRANSSRSSRTTCARR
jgi:hypothetical protein